jgi:hypothetical protein
MIAKKIILVKRRKFINFLSIDKVKNISGYAQTIFDMANKKPEDSLDYER